MHSVIHALQRYFDLIHRLFASRRGISALEFALVAPVLILIFGGLVDVGRAWYDSMSMSMAARSAVEYARNNPRNTTGIQLTAVKSGGVVEGTSVETSLSCSCQDGSRVVCTGMCPSSEVPFVYITVVVSGAFEPLLPNFGFKLPSVISRSATLRVQ